jgi:hypothetical protein
MALSSGVGGLASNMLRLRDCGLAWVVALVALLHALTSLADRIGCG